MLFLTKEKEYLPEISVKTRVGMTSLDETEALAKIFNHYDFARIIVHPRVREDYYENKPSLEAFRVFYDICSDKKLTYNGDLYTVSDVDAIKERFPKIDAVMLGRGVLMDPTLPLRIADPGSKQGANKLGDFLSELWDEYASYLSGERDVLFKMKDLWNFLGKAYPASLCELKMIKKAKTRTEYDSAVKAIVKLSSQCAGF